MMRPRLTKLWRCPKCRRRFANRNQSHSCGHHTIESFLKGRNPQAVAFYNGFVSAVQECGVVHLAPAKTRIGFQVRMIFAAINRVNDFGLEAHVVLARRLENPRFTRIESLSAGNHVHHFRIHSLEEIDDEVRSWLREAYDVGAQRHLAKGQRDKESPT
jgi:hypothetical protein